jgi:hypothetical protein
VTSQKREVFPQRVHQSTDIFAECICAEESNEAERIEFEGRPALDLHKSRNSHAIQRRRWETGPVTGA